MKVSALPFELSTLPWWLLPALITPPLIIASSLKLMKCNDVCDESTTESLPLLDGERTKMMIDNVPSIDSITFFNGKPPIEDIKSRLKQIVRANPWIAGHLVKRANSIYLEYARESENLGILDQIFRELSADSIDTSRSYTEMVTSLQHTGALVPLGKVCLKSNSALFKVSVIRMETKKFALVVSLSHVIADGHTYYLILKMLSKNANIITLNPQRKLYYNDLKSQLIGKEEDAFPISLKLIISIVWKLISRPMFQSKLYNINKSTISKMKLQSNDTEVSFVSSNDVITSDFLSRVKARIGMMAINWRNRVKSIEHNDAGNYEGLMIFNGQTDANETADYAKPSLIRKSLKPNNDGVYQRPRHPNSDSKLSKLPTCLELLKGEISIISNWSNFGFEQISFSDCEQKMHLPLLTPTLFHICVIFTPRPQELAALVLSDCFHTNGETPFIEVASNFLSQMWK